MNAAVRHFSTAFDWHRAMAAGRDMALEDARRGATPGEPEAMWALLKEAAQVSRVAYRAPPNSGWPRKSAMPDAPDDVSHWHLIAAYLAGQLDEMPTTESRPPMPSAAQISRSEAVLYLWHCHALARKGDKSRIKKAVYLKACGVPDRKIRAVTGLSRQQIHRAKIEAMDDMLEAVF